MATYSIKELSLFCGIKAHTIRVWEKRYNLFSPERTQTNIRRYSDDDLKLALNIKLLQSMGYKISHISKMPKKDVVRIVSSGNEHVSSPSLPEGLFLAAKNLDSELFSKKINESIEEKDIEWTYEKLIVPFQKRMGLLWQAGAISPAQEHFASNILRNLLIEKISRVETSNRNSTKMIFFLPEGELHEISLLYFNYIANKEGISTYYLGQSVPTSDVLEVAHNNNVYNFFTSITIPIDDDSLISMLNQLLSSNSNAKVFATGSQLEQLNESLPNEIIRVSSASSFREEL
ncbi:MAG: MerR family transcriptional regulator [Bacteroidales bacterium]